MVRDKVSNGFWDTTNTKGLGEGAEPDWVQFQSSVFVHRVLLGIDVQRFIDSPFHAVNNNYDAVERVDLIDNYDFPARTISKTETKTWPSFW